QRRNHQFTTRTAEVARATGRLEAAQADVLRGVADSQRAIAERLGIAAGSPGAEHSDGVPAGSPSGIAGRVANLQRWMERNRLEDTELARELERLRQETERIAKESMEPAARDARETARQSELSLADGGAV